jgi:uncharacterized protein
MHDFSKYKAIKVPINRLPYTLYVADTPQKRQKGMSDVKTIMSNMGMIFLYEESVDLSFSMAKTSVPLQVIFINENFEIIEQFTCSANQQVEIKPFTEYKYVIEVF